MMRICGYHQHSRVWILSAIRSLERNTHVVSRDIHHSQYVARSFATRRRRSQANDREEDSSRVPPSPPSITSVDFAGATLNDSFDNYTLGDKEKLDQDLLVFTPPKRYKPALRPEDDLTPKEREELEDNRYVERRRAGLAEREEDDVDEDDEDLEFEENEEDGQGRTEMSKKLLALARVNYRHVQRLPEWFLERQSDICSHRTAAQIRRCLKSWMVKYDQDLMNKYRQRVIGWKEGDDHTNGATSGSGSTNPSPVGKMVYGPEETTAYAYYHMPARFSVQARLFEEIKQILPPTQFMPKRILDFGCGPATAAAAAASVWSEEGDIHSYTGVEISQAMIDAGKIMTRDIIPNATFWTRNADIVTRAITKNERYDLIVASYTLTELSSDAARKAATQLLYELLDINGILVLVEQGNPFGSHTVRTARQFLIDMMKNVDDTGKFTNPNYLVLNSKQREADMQASKTGKNVNIDNVEGEFEVFNKGKKHVTIPGMMILPPPTSSEYPKLAYDQLYAKVVAPCTHDRKCPLPYGSWCSFSQRVHSGTIRKDAEEKYSYVVIQKLVKGSVEKKGSSSSINSTLSWIPTALREYVPLRRSISESSELIEASPLQILQSFTTGFMSNLAAKGSLKKRQDAVNELIQQSDWEAYNPTLKREEFARLLRSPLKGTGHITMDLCLPNGHLHRYVHSRSEVEALPRLYNAMRKIAWGGLLPAFMIEPTYTTMMRSRSMKESEKGIKLEKRGRTNEKRRSSESNGEVVDSDIRKALEEFLAAEKTKEKPPTKHASNPVEQESKVATMIEEQTIDIARGSKARRRSSLSGRRNISDM